MLIKISDTQWIDSRFIRRLFVQHNRDDGNENFQLAADLGDKTVYGTAYRNFREATKNLDWLAQAISEATRHEK